MRVKEIIFLVLIIILTVGSVYYFSRNPGRSNKFLGSAIVYKTPTCSCCQNYISYLESKGFSVEKREVSDEELERIKKENGVPYDLASCHTVLINNYVVEGHIPIEAIEKLLNEKPSIKGIALPGMPSGSPGMSGLKFAPFKVHSFQNGQDSGLFMEI